VAWKLIWTEDDAGVADGLATLDGAAKVIQDPANAVSAPEPSKIPKAMPTGKIAVGWLPTDEANGIPSLDATKRVVSEGLLVGGIQVVGAQSGPIADPLGGLTIDNECRASVTLILNALRGHGLIEP
jgi:hypothetical protein